MHGLFLSGGKFRHLVPALVAAGLRPVAFDAPGHGASAGSFVDVDNVADAILTVADVIGPLSGIVAHSMGAAWALRALGAGLTAPSVVCVGAPVRLDAAEYYAARAEMDVDVAAHFRRLMSAVTVAPGGPLDVAASQRSRALIVHDHDDPLAPFSDGEELARAWRSSRTLWTSRLGHFRTLAARAVLAAVVDFLREPHEQEVMA